MLRSSAIVLLAALAGACSSTPAQSTTSNVDPPTLDAAPPAPLLIRGRGQRDAPWLEYPFRDQLDLSLDDRELVAVGAAVAIISTSMGRFAVERAGGVSGPLNPPEDATWIGVGGRADAFFAADKEGVLYRADTPAAASRGFIRVARIDGARRWDAAPGIVVAAAADRVHFSADGSSFATMPSVGKGLIITELFARHDGVVVARARNSKGIHDVFVTSDRKRWRVADYQPVGLSRSGAWIAGKNAGCVEVLTSDKLHWVRTSEPSGLTPWDINLDHGDSFDLHPPANHLTATTPPAPAYDADSDANGSFMRCTGNSRPMPGTIGLLSRRHTALDPIRGSLYPRQPITRTEIDALSDGLCAVDSAGECDEKLPPARMPHALTLDRQSGQLRVLSLPSHCHPYRVDAIAGLGLLLCRKGTTLQAHTLAGDVFVAERTLSAADITATGVASDGTIGLASCGANGCKLFVRMPVAVGLGGGWRELDIGGAIAYRLLPGGRVLAVVEEHAEQNLTDFSLVLSRPGSVARTLTSSIRVTGFVEALDVDTDNHVFLTLSRAGEPTSKWLVGDNGQLLAAD